jgi:hypothetical protein
MAQKYGLIVIICNPTEMFLPQSDALSLPAFHQADRLVKVAQCCLMFLCFFATKGFFLACNVAESQFLKC